MLVDEEENKKQIFSVVVASLPLVECNACNNLPRIVVLVDAAAAAAGCDGCDGDFVDWPRRDSGCRVLLLDGTTRSAASLRPCRSLGAGSNKFQGSWWWTNS